jgi:hypothetical protein
MADTGFESRLRDELAAAADRVDDPGPAAPPAAGYLRRVGRRRRRTAAVAVGLPLVAVVALVGAMVGPVRGGGGDPSVRTAGSDAVEPTARRVLPGTDPVAAEGLSPLRRPMVTALDDGFMIWGGDYEGGSLGIGAVFRESTGTWQFVPEGPLTSRVGAATTWTGDEVVIAGGHDDTTGGGMRQDVAAFDPASGTWRDLPDLPEPRGDATALAAAGRIVLAGGAHPTGSSSPTVLVTDGRGPWTGVDVGHPVYGGIVVGDRVVVYGMDDRAGERAPLELSLVDPVTREVTPLPALLPAEWVTADYVGNLAVGSDGGDVVVVLGGDGDHALQRLDLGAQAWSEPLRVRYDGRFLAPERMRGTVTGVVVMAGSDGATPWVITGHGAYAIDPDDGRVDGLGKLDERCAGHRSVDDVTTFAVGPASTLLWVDGSCDGQIGLAGQEGALLLSLGAGQG